MKKVFFAIGLLISIQSLQAQATLGIHGNAILANASYETDDDEFDFDPEHRVSWKAGIVADVPLTDRISFMPQLNLLSKGTKINDTESGQIQGVPVTVITNLKFYLTYIELPLNFVYNAGDEYGGFFIGVGPSISAGIGGKVKTKFTFSAGGDSQSEEDEVDVKFDGDDDADDEDAHFKRFEFGANAIAGYRFANGLFVQANYNHGISNINTNDDVKARNRYFGFGIGWFFNAGGVAK